MRSLLDQVRHWTVYKPNNIMVYEGDRTFTYGEIFDRAKEMIISGAENIYTVEVENAIYKHPAVLEAAVVAVPDEGWGEAVKACVVPTPGMSTIEEDIISFSKTQIASYECPKSIDFLDALPKSGAGKILKRELGEKCWKG